MAVEQDPPGLCIALCSRPLASPAGAAGRTPGRRGEQHGGHSDRRPLCGRAASPPRLDREGVSGSDAPGNSQLCPLDRAPELSGGGAVEGGGHTVLQPSARSARWQRLRRDPGSLGLQPRRCAEATGPSGRPPSAAPDRGDRPAQGRPHHSRGVGAALARRWSRVVLFRSVGGTQ